MLQKIPASTPGSNGACRVENKSTETASRSFRKPTVTVTCHRSVKRCACRRVWSSKAKQCFGLRLVISATARPRRQDGQAEHPRTRSSSRWQNTYRSIHVLLCWSRVSRGWTLQAALFRREYVSLVSLLASCFAALATDQMFNFFSRQRPVGTRSAASLCQICC